MNQMGKMPLFRLVVPLISGIIVWLIAAWMVPLKYFVFFYLAWITLSFCLVFFIRYNFGFRWVIGALLQLLFFVAGYHHAQNNSQHLWPDHFGSLVDKGGYLQVRVIEPASEKKNTYQIICQAQKYLNDSISTTVGGRVIVYLQKDSLSQNVDYGDVLIIPDKLRLLSPPQNPGEFDYRRFLEHRNIFHRIYLPTGEWYFTGINKGNNIVSKALELRHYSVETLTHHLGPGREFAVASALLLGYKDDLDDELQSQFAGAGAMHILCVSGLHVGMIFLMLKFCLGFLRRIRYGAFIQTLLMIVLIWFYAAITGFSPSVIRASAMFSFLAIGQSFRRKTNVYNTLAASALIMIIADPYIVTYVGFQLSYIAVAGIVFLQPWLYRLVYSRYYLTNKAWEIISVSIAAQLFTAPLVLYYFNQFPNYFIITNLVVIPLAGVIIFSAFITLILSLFPLAGFLAGKLLYYLVYSMHSSVRFIEGLKYSTTSGVFITFPEALLIYAIILSLCLLIMVSGRRYLVASLAFTLMLSVSVSARTIINQKVDKFVVYNVRNGLAIDFISKGRCVFFSCSSAKEDPLVFDYQISGNRLRSGIPGGGEVVFLDDRDIFRNGWFYRRGHFLRFHDLTFYILGNDSMALPDKTPDIRVDYLIVSQNPQIKPLQALEVLQPGFVIFDPSNSLRNIEKWRTLCDEMNIAHWVVSSQGAYQGRASGPLFTRKGSGKLSQEREL